MSQKRITSFFQRKEDKLNISSDETLNPPKKFKTSSSNIQHEKVTTDEDNKKITKLENIQETKNNEKIDLKLETKEELPASNETKEVVNSEMKSEVKREKCRMLMEKVISNKPDIVYDPSVEKYDPIKNAIWKQGESVPYLALARTFQLIEETRGRTLSIEILGNYFWSVIKLTPDDLLPSVYLSINQLAPAYEGIELGVAEVSLMKVICNTTGTTLKHIKSQTQSIGDLGLVAEQSRIAQRMMIQPAPVSVKGVYQKLRKIAGISGQSKFALIQDVFVACRLCEARYFIRSLIGKLRIGIAELSLIVALAHAFIKANMTTENVHSKKRQESNQKLIDDATMLLKVVYSQCPNFDKIIPTALKFGLDDLQERCPMEPGRPIKPMLAQPTRGIREVLDRLDSVLITCEYKYDGERAQIHCDANGTISIFSRNQENNTTKYPDVIARMDTFKKEGVSSYMVDSEIVAWDVERKQILPFQVLTTRKRKNVDINEIKVKVCVFAFDLLYLNGESLVTRTFAERRRLLKEHFKETEGEWHFPLHCDTSDIEEIQQLLEESIKGNCEGLMVKTLEKDATYEIAKRSHNWLKLKKDYLSSVGDSLDLVVIGGYKGKGKRTGAYGGFLLACYDIDNEEYQCICKIGTGFSDEDLKTHDNFLKDHIIEEPKSYYRFDSSLEPDSWFEPIQVWEVKCADLSLSPIHKAGIGIVDPERGISLRFPRFIRIRLDKTPEMATSAQQVADMYSSQDQIKNQQEGKQSNIDYENDYY